MAATPATSRSQFGAGELFLADSRLAFAVLNVARVRILQRLFGISPQQANLLTFVMAVTAGHTAAKTAGRVVSAPLRISGMDVAMGGFLAREGAVGGAGPSVGDISLFERLVCDGLSGCPSDPVLRCFFLLL